MEKRRLYVDMDGTLAVFRPVDQLETLYEEEYFRNLKPHNNVVQAIRHLIEEHKEIEVHILSSYLTDSQYALKEKNEWLDTYLPEIDKEHRIFVACGKEKKTAIADGIGENDYLLDDYSKNLMEWHPPGSGMKLLNGINHTRGTWQHDRISFERSPAELVDAVVAVVLNKKQVRDDVEYCKPSRFSQITKNNGPSR